MAKIDVFYQPKELRYAIYCTGDINGERYVAVVHCEHEKYVSAAAEELLSDFESGKIPIAKQTSGLPDSKERDTYKPKSSSRVMNSASSSLNNGITINYDTSYFSDTSTSCSDGGIC